MSIRCFILCLFIGAGCRSRPVAEAPLLLHFPGILHAGRPDSVVVKVQGAGEEWKFVLLTQRQPILLKPEFHQGAGVIPLQFPFDFYQGPAVLCCMHGERRYFYSLLLVDDRVAGRPVIQKEYRSPKTVNPDSSLAQQRICFDLDTSRNILPYARRYPGMPTPYFYSDTVWLPPVARTLVVQPPANISAVYVQPGTVGDIALRGAFSVSDRGFSLWTENLQDRFGNAIADGTMVDFVFYPEGGPDDDNGMHQVESPAVRGAAAAFIPGEGVRRLRVYVRIGTIRSKVIRIAAP